MLLARSDRMPRVQVGDEVTLRYDGPPVVAYAASLAAGLGRNGTPRRDRNGPAPQQTAG